MMGRGGGGPSHFFGSEILAQVIYERCRDFGSQKKNRAWIFLGCENRTNEGIFLGMLKKVVIF